jgi:hypothetical protein
LLSKLLKPRRTARVALLDPTRASLSKINSTLTGGARVQID